MSPAAHAVGPIVCGTDFSEPSLRAVRAAGRLAARMQTPLHLVHAIELSADTALDTARGEAEARAGRQLSALVDGLGTLGASVQIHLVNGPPDEALQELAARVSAKLIVVAALGQRHPDRWQLGSHAERLAQRSHVPVLVVRDLEPFEAWTQAQRPLRILLGADFSLSCEAAMRFIADLRAFGPCEVVAVHLYWPPTQFHRLGLAGVRNYIEPDPEVTKALERDFSAKFAQTLGAGPIKARFEPHMGRIGSRLAILASDEQVDLVVVGSHARGGAERILLGSVSHDVTHWAKVSVACIPGPAFTRATATPELRNVLVATDFSPTGNAAVPLAYAIVGQGGTVHLVHVVKEHGKAATDPRDIFAGDSAQSPEAQEARSRLLELVPQDAATRTTATQLHVLASNDTARAITQAAERLDVAALCLGTHGRSGLSKAVLGSVAQAVLGQTARPLLLARKPLE